MAPGDGPWALDLFQLFSIQVCDANRQITFQTHTRGKH